MLSIVIYSFLCLTLVFEPAETKKLLKFNNGLITCDLSETINITNGHFDKKKGEFHHDGLIYTHGMFAEFDFVTVNDSVKVQADPHIRGCVCQLKKCLRVCRFCTDEEEFVDERCVKTEVLSMPGEDNVDMAVSLKDSSYAVLEGKICPMLFLEPDDDDEDKWIFKDGSIELINVNRSLDHQQYCFVQKVDDESGDKKVYKTVARRCYERDEKNTENSMKSMYPFGMLISLPFLLATFLIYGCTPELRNLHGKSLMCYIVGLMVFYIGIIIVNLDKKLYNETIECKAVGYVTYIGVLSCFFWLNIICYDIWSAFKVGMRTHGSDQKRFLLYSIYAFGVPIIFTLFVYAIDMTNLIPTNFKPQMGINRCWVGDAKIIEAIYVYIPISIILIVNIVLYSVTAYTIHRVQKETAIVRRGESQRHSKMDADKDKFFLYLRLFIVMGSTWLMESISFFFDTPSIFYVTDLLNCLQGLLIFILFVWKPKVKKILLKRFGLAKSFPIYSSSNQQSTTRQSDTTTRISTVRKSSLSKLKAEQSILNPDVSLK